jgi:meso-butanediol dehydrogenase/(S,S)-butanediol dehydrogenase/diacetyl reductase
MGRLDGKIAAVTGGASGIGEAIVRRFVAEGASVAFCDRDGARGQRVAAELEAAGGRVAFTEADVGTEAACLAFVNGAADRFGRLDILVNNAGVGYLFGPIVEMEAAHLDTVLGVNLRAPHLAIKHAARLMIRGGAGGRIVNIASQAGKSGFAMATAYTASKHGLIGLTRAAALELAPYAITVNAVCPNHVTTGLGAWQNDFMARARGESVADYLSGMRARIPLGRVGVPDDTAAAVVFLCSDAAGYITAEAMNVSGGEEYH